MKSFQLEKPILDAVENRVNEAIASGSLPSNSSVEFLEYEPDEGYVHSADFDGVIAVFSASIMFSSADVGNDGAACSDSDIIVYAFGFGRPIPKTGDDYDPTVLEAHKRAQALITLAYQAIMDKRQIYGDNDTVAPYFGSGVDFGADRIPVKIEKFQTLGTTNVRRGVCGYKGTFRFKVEEITPEESLGGFYAGVDNLDVITKNPGD